MSIDSKACASAARFMLAKGLAAAFFEENRASIELFGRRCGHYVAAGDLSIVEVRGFPFF